LTDHDLFSAENADAYRAFDRRVIEAGAALQAEEVAPQDDGPHTYISIKYPLLDPSGRPYAVCGISTDITERKVAEAERERLLAAERHARSEAELANRAKDEFLATLSHELRTPLTAILGWAEILSTEQLEEAERLHGLVSIERNARVQVQLVKDLLDVSYIVSGRLKLEMELVRLAAIVESVLDTLRPAAEAKQIRVECRFEGDLPLLRGDPLRLQQVAWNLLSNALKFTPQNGVVRVVVRRVAAAIELEVRDDGIGIEADFLPHVFERFRQADASSTRVYGGLGLGLAIVRHLVELHGGTVAAASAGENQGASFTVSLPLPTRALVSGPSPEWWRPTGSASSSSPIVDLGGVSVLVVEDDRDALELVRGILLRCNADVRVASSADEALSELDLRVPDVLVSDIGMPTEDGYGLIRRIRQRSAERGGRVPALALTAFAHDEDRHRALRAGYQAHLSKPFAPRELLHQVAALSGRSARAA
jgi:signal transduction histidine kinase/ActR/RegA family two-component response regulator